MSQSIDDRKVFTLLEVTRSIQQTLAKRYTSSFWVKAEMNKLNHYTHSGHCYPDLVEKHQGKVIAQVRANLWKYDYYRINNRFLQVLREPLKDGIKILFQAKISFDPVYGLSLHILDIDPSFTLGDLEKEKQETIQKLRDEQLFDRNKKLDFPLLPQRVAVISVETSKGYADFLRVIDNNAWGYKFFHFLFPSILQGEKAVNGIIGQLSRIEKLKHHFDLVAIIRGGGGDIGLSCYNDFDMARAIAEFPLPVITGIGHATNETVAEIVGYENAITPTKLAELLIQHFHNFAEPVRRAQETIVELSGRRLTDEKTRLASEVKLFRSATRNILGAGRREITNKGQALAQGAIFLYKNEKKILEHLKIQYGKQSQLLLHKHHTEITAVQKQLPGKTNHHLGGQWSALEGLERTVKALHPDNVLKRGYSITLKNGKPVTSKSQVATGEEIETVVIDGKFSSVVKLKNAKS